ALVYRTDVAVAGDAVEAVGFPEALRAVNDYPIVALRDAPNPSAAQALVAHVRSDAGQAVLADAGFPPATCAGHGEPPGEGTGGTRARAARARRPGRAARGAGGGSAYGSAARTAGVSRPPGATAPPGRRWRCTGRRG